MPAPLRAILNVEEVRTLRELRVASCVPYRVRDRAHMVLLNADGWNAPALAEMFQCHEHTARAAIGLGNALAWVVYGKPKGAELSRSGNRRT